MSSSTRHRPAGEDGTRPSASRVPSHDWTDRIRAGDEAAFEAMFRTYYDGLCRYVATYLGSRDIAEDVVQGVFARIWEDRTHWMVTDLQHYLYAAVRRRAMSQFRRAAVRRRALPLLALEAAANAPADADFEAEELRQRLERALSALPPPHPRRIRLEPQGGFELRRGGVADGHFSEDDRGPHQQSAPVLRKALLPS